MRTPSAAFIAKLTGQELNITEVFELTLSVGTIFYFTSLDRDVVFDGHTYTTLPIQRGAVSYNINLSPDSVEVSMASISQGLALEAENGTLDGSMLTIKRIFYDEVLGEGSYLTLFSGRCSISYNRNAISLKANSILDSLNVQVPRNLYQEPCNHTLFSAVCGVIKVKTSGTASATSTDLFSLTASALAEADKYFDIGELYIKTGQNTGARRMITSFLSKRFTVAVPFRYVITSGDTFDCYQGCDKTAATCRNKFNNAVNFFGMIYIPKPETVLWGLLFLLPLWNIMRSLVKG